jgi:hypothetical protein
VLNLASCREDAWGNGGMTPRIRNLDTECRWEVSFTRCRFYSWKWAYLYPVARMLVGPKREISAAADSPVVVPYWAFPDDCRSNVRIVETSVRNKTTTEVFRILWFVSYVVSFVRFALKRRREKLLACRLFWPLGCRGCGASLVFLTVSRKMPWYYFNAGPSSVSTSEGHTDYCGQVHGPHVET